MTGNDRPEIVSCPSEAWPDVRARVEAEWGKPESWIRFWPATFLPIWSDLSDEARADLIDRARRAAMSATGKKRPKMRRV